MVGYSQAHNFTGGQNMHGTEAAMGAVHKGTCQYTCLHQTGHYNIDASIA